MAMQSSPEDWAGQAVVLARYFYDKTTYFADGPGVRRTARLITTQQQTWPSDSGMGQVDVFTCGQAGFRHSAAQTELCRQRQVELCLTGRLGQAELGMAALWVGRRLHALPTPGTWADSQPAADRPEAA